MQLFAVLSVAPAVLAANNLESGYKAVIAGGDGNEVKSEADYAAISGGRNNIVTGNYASMTGGAANMASSNFAVVTGGYANKATGRFGAVLGGSKNTASGRWSTAMGYQAVVKADNSASFAFSGQICEAGDANTVRFCANHIKLDAMSVTISKDGGATQAAVATALDVEMLQNNVSSLTRTLTEAVQNINDLMAEQKVVNSRVTMLEAWTADDIPMKYVPLDPACVIDVLSVDHASGSENKYFNFEVDSANGCLGINGWSNTVFTVAHTRDEAQIWQGEVVLWAAANGGSEGDGHGRRTVAPAAGQFKIGDKLEIICFIRVLSIDNSYASDGVYFNFYSDDVSSCIKSESWGANVAAKVIRAGESDWTVHKHTIQLLHGDDGGSVGDSRGHIVGDYFEMDAAQLFEAGDLVQIDTFHHDEFIASTSIAQSVGELQFNVDSVMAQVETMQAASTVEAVPVDTACLLQVESIDHTSGIDGQYFNFDVNTASNCLEATTWSNKVFNAVQRRDGAQIWAGEVVMWGGANGGTIGDGHGRRTVSPASGQWVPGDIIELRCNVKVTSVDNSEAEDGVYFNFDSDDVRGCVGRTDWSGHELGIKRIRSGSDDYSATVTIYDSADGGSTGDARGIVTRNIIYQGADEYDQYTGHQCTGSGSAPVGTMQGDEATCMAACSENADCTAFVRVANGKYAGNDATCYFRRGAVSVPALWTTDQRTCFINNRRTLKAPDAVCSQHNFCIGFEKDFRVYCYGKADSSGCPWGSTLCSKQSDCTGIAETNTGRYTDGDFPNCWKGGSGWRGEACVAHWLPNVALSSTNYDFTHQSGLNVLNTDFVLTLKAVSTNFVYPRSTSPLYFGVNPTSVGHVGISIGHGTSVGSNQIRFGDGSKIASATFSHTKQTIGQEYEYKLTCHKSGGKRECSMMVNGVAATPPTLSFDVDKDVYKKDGGVFGNVWGWRFIGTLKAILVEPAPMRTEDLFQAGDILKIDTHHVEPSPEPESLETIQAKLDALTTRVDSAGL